jgi:hypothetical protein
VHPKEYHLCPVGQTGKSKILLKSVFIASKHPFVLHWHSRLFMDAKPNPSRKTRQTGIRFFEDQLEDLKWLVVHKHRNRRTVASLAREAADQYIESEKNGSK